VPHVDFSNFHVNLATFNSGAAAVRSIRTLLTWSISLSIKPSRCIHRRSSTMK
jgi:hypothetical protein